MGQQLTVAEQRQQAAKTFRGDIQRMESEISAALPPHIPAERFIRVVITAVQGDPALLDADRKTLFEASMRAAQDGLLPDKREGALVIFKGRVQWMPMIGGILKKVRNSGELVSIGAHIAYENDRFAYVLGDEERIEHEPKLDGDRGKPRAAYAIAKTKDGGIYREVMSLGEIEKVRKVSRAANNGPWVEWWEEMARKTVLRRLSKRLPMSTDLDDLIRRDDDLYDFSKKGADGQVDRMFKPVADPLRDTIEHEAGGEEEEQPATEERPEGEAAAPADDETQAGGTKQQKGRERLYVAAREAAGKGSTALADFRANLTDQQDRALDPILAELMQAAERADEDGDRPADDDGFPGDEALQTLRENA
ncbi:recombinase RecT [Methylorubrum extorquens]|uniref:recombinase RecT n=1 Tax=Methylorubrum extorquens TaxID=408 RepID=UPI0022386ECA|nr:recombinase RecT [Methylorubrum extorquens]UYW33667.1 recombinase RecT [Methylorubrum extorquens]